MNIQRFTAATSREALAKARMAFGEQTLILSNRPTEHGVEVVAAAEDTLSALDQGHAQPSRKLADNPLRAAKPVFQDAVHSKVEDDATQLAMSTLSFQDYVRERMLRKQHEARTSSGNAAPRAADAPPQKAAAPIISNASAPPTAPRPKTSTTRMAPERIPQGIADELHAMKQLMEDRFNTLAWLGTARQNPIQANLMLKLIRAGYSPNLARTILERMAQDINPAQAVQWVMDILTHNLHTDAPGTQLQDEGGVFALTGATGVGKTTTAAKLAGLCARTHGPGSVGLITLDTYRMGAHEQLRAYGKILGVVAHLAHDQGALQDLLGLLSNKKMVLIDTTGVAPRDPRKHETLELLNLPEIKRLLVLNAGSHGDMLDETVEAFASSDTQQVILSKTDEAVKLGPALDVIIRHRLMLRGITTGQRVPEDWEHANAAQLVRSSMRNDGLSAYDPKVGELGFYFGQAGKPVMLQEQYDA